MTGKYFELINLLLLAVAILLGVNLFFNITSDRVDVAHFGGADTQQTSTAADKPDQPLSDNQPIIDRNPKNTRAGRTTDSEKINRETPIKTNLKLKLLGTVTGGNNRPYAVIEETAKQRQQLYREGTSIKNAIIKQIMREKVVLRVNSRDQILEMDKARFATIASNDDDSAFIEDGQTALMDACNSGLKEKVVLLIAQGAEVNARDAHGNTPLMHAARSGYSEIVQILIENGADIHLRDNLGNTPLIASARYAGEFALRVIEILIAEGANVKAKNRYSTTALMNAARSGQKDVVELLIAEGADINAKSTTGQTALKLASDALRKDVIDVLNLYNTEEQ